MPDQRACLSEPIAAFGAREWLHVNVPLVVHNQTCARRERLWAGDTVRVNEVALEHRFVGARALDWDPNPLIGVIR